MKLLPLDWLIETHGDEHGAGAPAIHGTMPLPWWSSGNYTGSTRHLLLKTRMDRKRVRLIPLVRLLSSALREVRLENRNDAKPLLVAMPSWKRHSNPLPQLIARQLSEDLGWPQARILGRSRPVLGQHKLHRELRWVNQNDSFRSSAVDPRHRKGGRTVLLVDDILTTGATATNAAMALREGGWNPMGIACLARTPLRQAVI